MTRLIIVLALCCLQSPAALSQGKADLTNEGLRGPVQSVSGESAESISSDGLTEKGRNKKLDSLKFNPKGQLIERVAYDDYGFLIGNEKYFHNSAGYLIKAEFRDPQRRLIENRIFAYGKDKQNSLTTYDADGKITLKQIYLYDREGRLKEEIYYSRRKVTGKTSFKMDASGNLLEAAFYLPNGEKAVAPIGPCFNVHRVANNYDGLRRVIEQTSYEPTGTVKRRSSYSYDEKDNIAEESRTDIYSKHQFVHSYEYDTYGNWTKDVIRVHTSRLPLSGDKPDESTKVIVRTRKITYY